MNLQEWFRHQRETYRREFDERYHQQRLLAMRDAFLVVIGVVLLLPFLSYVLRMPALAALLPIAVIFLGGLGGLVSLLARNAYTPRGAAYHALWQGGGAIVGYGLGLMLLALILPAEREYVWVEWLSNVGAVILVWLVILLFARRNR